MSYLLLTVFFSAEMPIDLCSVISHHYSEYPGGGPFLNMCAAFFSVSCKHILLCNIIPHNSTVSEKLHILWAVMLVLLISHYHSHTISKLSPLCLPPFVKHFLLAGVNFIHCDYIASSLCFVLMIYAWRSKWYEGVLSHPTLQMYTVPLSLRQETPHHTLPCTSSSASMVTCSYDRFAFLVVSIS